MVVMLRFNKNIIIVFLLLSVFAVGTLNFVETVEAAKWKKYDSGKFTDYYSGAENKKIASYQSFIKGNNELYVNIYSISKKTGKKKLANKITISKKKNVIKIVDNNYGWGEVSTWKFKTSMSVKTHYKFMMKDIIKESSVHPSKAAFDIQTFNIENQTLKAYSIKYDKNYIVTYFYSNNTEAMTMSLEKYEDQLNIRMWDEKRELLFDQTIKTPLSLNYVYNFYMKIFDMGFKMFEENPY